MIILTITLIIISYIRHSTSKRIIAIVLKRMVMMIAIAMKMASSMNKKRITNRQTDKSGEAGRSRVSASLWAIQSRAPGKLDRLARPSCVARRRGCQGNCRGFEDNVVPSDVTWDLRRRVNYSPSLPKLINLLFLPARGSLASCSDSGTIGSGVFRVFCVCLAVCCNSRDLACLLCWGLFDCVNLPVTDLQ